MRSTVCFTSDFGLADAWVGVCHAVIYDACPHARVVDLSHLVPPFDLRKAAVLAAAGVHQLPDAIHLVVVDPGVGGPRRDLCLVTRSGTRMIGPDNGALVPAALRGGGVAKAYSIESVGGLAHEPLPTFHARDVMAPAAAALACGADPASIGAPFDPSELQPAPFPPCRREGENVVAEVVDIDRFGSIRVGVGAEELDRHGLSDSRIELSFGHLVLALDIVGTFADVERGEPAALVDSSGWLTLAVREGSAAERYGLEPGAMARVRAI